MVKLINMNRSDQQLIADYLAGDEKLLEVIVSRYLKPIYSFVYKYVGDGQDAEDVTQEVFLIEKTKRSPGGGIGIRRRLKTSSS